MGTSKESTQKKTPASQDPMGNLNPQLKHLTKKDQEALVTKVIKELRHEEQEQKDSKHGKK